MSSTPNMGGPMNGPGINLGNLMGQNIMGGGGNIFSGNLGDMFKNSPPMPQSTGLSSNNTVPNVVSEDESDRFSIGSTESDDEVKSVSISVKSKPKFKKTKGGSS